MKNGRKQKKNNNVTIYFSLVNKYINNGKLN